MTHTAHGSDVEREIEFKRSIPDSEAFEALIAAAGGRRDPPVEQENHFFDTPDGVLSRQRIAFRLRREGQRGFTAALKGPTAERPAGAAAVREEIEWDVDPSHAEAVLSGRLAAVQLVVDGIGEASSRLVRAVLEAGRAAPFECLGSFRNERTTLATELEADGARVPVVLEFDRTRFPGGRVDFELELEVDAEGEQDRYRAALDGFLARCGVASVECPGKLSRFLELTANRSSPAPSRDSGRTDP